MRIHPSVFVAYAAMGILSSHAMAQSVTYEFISCEYRSSGSWAGCSVIPHEYVPYRGYLRTVTFNYTFNCAPGEASKFAIGAKARDQWRPFSFGQSGSTSFETIHAISIGNETAKRFYDSNFKPGCSLVVETIESGPTEGQLAKWRSDADTFAADVSAEKKLQGQLKTLSTLNAAFDILLSLVANLDASLRQQADLIGRIKSGEVTKALLGIAESTPDAGRANALRALVKEIERIRVDSTSDDVLARSLSPEDLATIRSVAKPDPDETRMLIDLSIKREGEAADKLWGTCYSGRRFIEIPICDASFPGVAWGGNP